jgi:hypothetical protein
MGTVNFRAVQDCLRHGADLGVTCGRCRRSAIFRAQEIAAYFRSLNWNDSFDLIGMRFRCIECGGRATAVRPVPRVEGGKVTCPCPVKGQRFPRY